MATAVSLVLWLEMRFSNLTVTPTKVPDLWFLSVPPDYGVVPQNRPLTPPPASFTVHCLLIILAV